jgi:sugar phosphate permease
VLGHAIKHEFHLSLSEVSVALAASNLGLLPALLPWGFATDRFGERHVTAIGLALSGAALVGAGFAGSYGLLVGLLAVSGAFGAAVYSATGRAVTTWFKREERGLALGIRQTAVPLGGAVASGLLPALATHVSVRSAFDALAIGCFAASIVGWSLLRSEPTGDVGEIGRPLRDARVWRLCFGSTFYVLTQISLVSFLVLFLHTHRGASTATAAGTLAATQVFGGVTRIVAGRWSDRLHARVVPLLRIAVALALAVALATALLDASRWLLVPALVLAGTLSLSWNGLSFTAAAETAGRARSGAAIGLQQSFLSAGAIVAPITFAAVVHHGSWRIAFALAAVSPLVGYAVLSPLSERRP